MILNTYRNAAEDSQTQKQVLYEYEFLIWILSLCSSVKFQLMVDE